MSESYWRHAVAGCLAVTPGCLVALSGWVGAGGNRFAYFQPCFEPTLARAGVNLWTVSGSFQSQKAGKFHPTISGVTWV